MTDNRMSVDIYSHDPVDVMRTIEGMMVSDTPEFVDASVEMYNEIARHLGWRYEYGTFGNHCERLGIKV